MPIERQSIPATDRLLLDTRDAADLLSVSPNTLEKLPIPRIKLPGVNVVRWKKTDLEDYVRGLGEQAA